MGKVYVHYVKLGWETKPRVSAYLSKKDALEQKQEYMELNKRSGDITKNQIRTVTF